MSTLAADEFLARDVYGAWTRLVEQAEASVWVLTPYLDEQLVRLLKKTNLPADQVIVVTDLSPGSGPANYRKKLLALKKLAAAGTQVRTLARLHAKVLAADGTRFAVGSQNFTTYARGSHEATAVPREIVHEERFRDTIRKWVESAEAVVEQDLDRLIGQLDDQIDVVEAAIDELVARFEAADRERQVRLAGEREAERQRRIAEIRANERARQAVESAQRQAQIARLLAQRVRSSPYRNVRGAAYGRLVDEWDQGGYFKIDSGESLTQWAGAGGRQVDLARLRFVPMILSPTGRLALVRVARGQMSYAARTFTLGSPVSVSGELMHVKVDFPDPEATSGVNLVITLREQEWSPSITLKMMYDLDSLDHYDTEQNDRVGYHRSLRLDSEDLFDAAQQLVDDEVEREDFLKRILRTTALTKFKGHGRTIGSFLESGRYRVDLLEAAGGVFLTARHG